MAKKGKSPKPAVPSKKPGPVESKFVEGLILRGEAVPASDGSVLPPGATHGVISEEGEKKVKRIRFSSR